MFFNSKAGKNMRSACSSYSSPVSYPQKYLARATVSWFVRALVAFHTTWHGCLLIVETSKYPNAQETHHLLLSIRDYPTKCATAPPSTPADVFAS